MDRDYPLPTSTVIGAKGPGAPGLFNRKLGDQGALAGDAMIYALMVSESPATVVLRFLDPPRSRVHGTSC